MLSPGALLKVKVLAPAAWVAVLIGEGEALILTWVPAEADPLLELQADKPLNTAASKSDLMNFKVIGYPDGKDGGFFVVAIQVVDSGYFDHSV